MEEGGGAQNANRSSEMRHKTCTVAQKMLLEEGAGHKTRTIRRKCRALESPTPHVLWRPDACVATVMSV